MHSAHCTQHMRSIKVYPYMHDVQCTYTEISRFQVILFTIFIQIHYPLELHSPCNIYKLKNKTIHIQEFVHNEI